jgi:hypothetical protein
LTLRARIARTTGAPHELIERFVVDLDAALRAIVESLRSGKPPGPLPPLRDDQLALRARLDERADPAIEVLASETDLIVDSVNVMAEILARQGAAAPAQ